MTTKYVYAFGAKEAEGDGTMRDLLGGKGAGLAEMTLAGTPVPPGFTITTETCNAYLEQQATPAEAAKQIDEQLGLLEKRMSKRLGDPSAPLLVSVRSGSRFSMPGMMDTVLNLGLNDETVEGLARVTENPRFAYDGYRRFIHMYSDVVLGIAHENFEKILAGHREKAGVRTDGEIPADVLRQVVADYKAFVEKTLGRPFPQDARAQLDGAIEAVFRSWNGERARTYRRIHHIPDDLGTACTIQAMVFGNMGDSSATGVGFTRNPATGEKRLYGEFLINAQGEDVVAGTRTPRPLAELKEEMPRAFGELEEIAMRLEKHYGDMQDFEFTIEDGTLYMLQTRAGKRTGMAAVHVATDMVDEGLISQEEAVLRVDPSQIPQLLHPVFDPEARAKHPADARGLNASPGAACGRLVFTADDAKQWAERGEKVILVRQETSPDDIHGMFAAVGVLTAAGGMTSHAAVVGRQMGKPSVVGCTALRIDMENRKLTVGEKVVSEGDWISIDGTAGEVICAQVPTTESEVVRVVMGELDPTKSALYGAFDRIMGWADEARRLRVRANADTGPDAALAIGFGAQGIGLCRTEHMFLGEHRLPAVREMILSRTAEERRAALEKILPMQREDFASIFRAMKGRPVTVRTLDPPLHEFLPSHEDLMVRIAVLKATGKNETEDGRSLAELEQQLERVEELVEQNPMLGWRGCRLGIIYPEITEMQARAIFEAAAICLGEGIDVMPEIMVPLVGHVEELSRQRALVDETAKAVMSEKGIDIPYTVGTMIEVPRGAITAGRIAEVAEFFSFGTNDLTQTTFGFSRDDAGRFLGHYVESGILEREPFVTVDREGVGELMRWAVEKGRATRSGIKLGICGEHGGDPESVAFCHELGLDYVSCSPYRIPVARMAAAHSALLEAEAREKRSTA